MQSSDSHTPPELTLQSLSSSSISSTPSLFSFPVLDGDGVPQNTEYPRRRQRTPPAALSSLGARARMVAPEDNMSESISSLADSHYDMVDDLSEISNDDHDTASIISNEAGDGQLTPEETPEDVDTDGQTFDLNIPPPFQARTGNATYAPTQTGRGQPSTSQAASLDTTTDSRNPQEHQLPSASIDVLDSFLSEDIDTPRQSVMPINFSSTLSRSEIRTRKHVTLEQLLSGGYPQGVKRILLFAAEGIPIERLDRISAKVASCLDSSSVMDIDHVRVIRLPETPSGGILPDATVIDLDGRLMATIQLCTGVQTNPKGRTEFCMKDTHANRSIIVDSEDTNNDLKASDIVVVHLEGRSATTNWLKAVCKAIHGLAKPVVFVAGPSVSEWRFMWIRDCIGLDDAEKRGLHYIPELSLHEADSLDLADIIKNVLDRAPPQAGRTLGRTYRSNTVRILLLMVLLFSAYFYSMVPDVRARLEPRNTVSTRRGALVASAPNLFNVSGSPEFTVLEHLIPQSLDNCQQASSVFGISLVECPYEVRYQPIEPNHVVVSLPGAKHFPDLIATEIYRESDRREIQFNSTRLIDGIYDIALDPEEAYGRVFVHVLTTSPSINVTVSHNFGNRLLQLKTYEKASKEVGHAISKDITVMRHAAKSITDQLSSQWKSSFSTAQNVTSRLTASMRLDLQAYTNTALAKASNLSSEALQSITTDIVVVHKDLVRMTKDLSTSIINSVKEAQFKTKQNFHHRLESARERSLKLRGVLVERKVRRANSRDVQHDRQAEEIKANVGKDLDKRFEKSSISTMPDALRNKPADNLANSVRSLSDKQKPLPHKHQSGAAKAAVHEQKQQRRQDRKRSRRRDTQSGKPADQAGHVQKDIIAEAR